MKKSFFCFCSVIWEYFHTSAWPGNADDPYLLQLLCYLSNLAYKFLEVQNTSFPGVAEFWTQLFTQEGSCLDQNHAVLIFSACSACAKQI